MLNRQIFAIVGVLLFLSLMPGHPEGGVTSGAATESGRAAETATSHELFLPLVANPCDLHWFFDEPAPVDVCPRPSLSTWAAAQDFEHGAMIWLQSPGRFYVLENGYMTSVQQRRTLTVISERLEIWRDTSGQYSPPPGYYAPVSGFGYVWRGDVLASPGFVDRLGWGLAPEFGYTAILQCDDVPPSGGIIW